MDRVDQGLDPACVTKCITKCLHFGDPAQKAQSKRDRYAKKVADFE
jgi:Fe-S-cluster-containing dehydrogenase component